MIVPKQSSGWTVSQIIRTPGEVIIDSLVFSYCYVVLYLAAIFSFLFFFLGAFLLY